MENLKGRKSFFLSKEQDEVAKGRSKAASQLTGKACNHKEPRIRLGFHLDPHTYGIFTWVEGMYEFLNHFLVLYTALVHKVATVSLQ